MIVCEKPPYENMRIYGPYERPDGRFHVVVYSHELGIRQTVSYPKYLMEMHIGRKLDPYSETVDHIDMDFTNNEISNLRIIPLPEHVRQDQKTKYFHRRNCAYCGDELSQERLKKIHRNRSKNLAGPFCGRRCAGLYGTDIQNGRADKIGPANLVYEEIVIKNIRV